MPRIAGLPDMPTARVMCIDGDMTGSIDRQADGRWCAWLMRTGAEHRERRRSDAKRWMIACAAGLAEVPRVRRPRGWHFLGFREVCDPWSGEVDTIEMHERNRRRR